MNAPEQHTPPAATHQHLSFRVGEAEYALPILQVREILAYGDVTRVPGVAGHFRGVLNLRGSVVPVVDLAVRFGHAPAPTTRRTCVVVVELPVRGEKHAVGLVADAVSEVLELATRDVEPVPAFGTGVRPDFLTGMGRHGQGFVLLLALGRILDMRDVHAAAAPSA